jgi:hypothetical protein
MAPVIDGLIETLLQQCTAESTFFLPHPQCHGRPATTVVLAYMFPDAEDLPSAWLPDVRQGIVETMAQEGYHAEVAGDAFTTELHPDDRDILLRGPPIGDRVLLMHLTVTSVELRDGSTICPAVDSQGSCILDVTPVMTKGAWLEAVRDLPRHHRRLLSTCDEALGRALGDRCAPCLLRSRCTTVDLDPGAGQVQMTGGGSALLTRHVLGMPDQEAQVAGCALSGLIRVAASFPGPGPGMGTITEDDVADLDSVVETAVRAVLSSPWWRVHVAPLEVRPLTSCQIVRFAIRVGSAEADPGVSYVLKTAWRMAADQAITAIRHRLGSADLLYHGNSMAASLEWQGSVGETEE